MVYKIGITGGIASGKSQCLKFLATLKSPRVYTMNLDLFAGKVYGLNPNALRNVESIFGEETVIKSTCNDLTSPVGVNRVALGDKVFRDSHQLGVLKSITSPEIKKLMLEHFAYVEA